LAASMGTGIDDMDSGGNNVGAAVKVMRFTYIHRGWH
jgi:hypothetical protein